MNFEDLGRLLTDTKPMAVVSAECCLDNGEHKNVFSWRQRFFFCCSRSESGTYTTTHQVGVAKCIRVTDSELVCQLN